MLDATKPTILTKTCPDCGGPIEIARGKHDGSKIIRKAKIGIEHRSTCPQWLRKCRQHGAHPDVTELVHEADEFVMTEWAA
jgi:hypothetical protein